MVNSAPTTRRWYDRGNPRDAGEGGACQRILTLFLFSFRGEKCVVMRHMLCAMGKRDAESDAPAEDFFLLVKMDYQHHQSEIMTGGLLFRDICCNALNRTAGGGILPAPTQLNNDP